MARIDELRKQRLEQALRDMGNYGVKLRKPEELPDFDQPIVTMFAKANTLRQVGCRSSEASRLRPHGKPPRCFS